MPILRIEHAVPDFNRSAGSLSKARFQPRIVETVEAIEL